MNAETDEVVRRVHEVVDDIPPGQVASYGQIGALIGAGPRQVARVLATSGGSLPWWRVTRADGSLPEGLFARASEYYRIEGTPVRRGRVLMAEARWVVGGP